MSKKTEDLFQHQRSKSPDSRLGCRVISWSSLTLEKIEEAEQELGITSRAKTEFGVRKRTVSEAKETRVFGDWDRRGHCSETIYT